MPAIQDAKARARRLKPGAGLLLALLVLAGCAGIEPYEVQNRREEGPKSGVFTGSEGEFVIFRLEDKSKPEEQPEKEDETEADAPDS